MGMKVKQDSKVKTFFKRLFKISKKKGQDGGWKHLDKDALYKLSRQSGLDSSCSMSDVDISSTKNKDSISTLNTTEVVSVDSNKLSDSLEISDIGQKTNKKRKVKKDQNKLLIEVVDSDGEGANISKSKSKKRDKNKKNTNSDKIELFRKSLSVDQELIDVDLNLVLSSFPNLKQIKPSHTDRETGDNLKNELLQQEVQSKSNTRQVEVVIENVRPENQKDTTPIVSKQEVREKSLEESFEKKGEVWERLVSGDDQTDSASPKTKKNQKNKQNNKKKWQKLKNEELDETLTSDEVKVKEPQEVQAEVIEEQVSSKDKKKKRKRNKKKKKDSVSKDEDDDVFDETCVSTEPLVLAKSGKKKKRQSDIPKAISDKYDALEEDDDEDHLTPVPEFEDVKKKKKKNKKRGSVRTPEDDLAEELADMSTRRPKHQVLWDHDDTITEQDTPELDRRQVGGSKKKLKRRRLKLKINKEKKKLGVKVYDELEDKDEGEKKDRERQSMGRRMWRACKSGWRYLKAGLIFYSKSPAASLTMTPMAQRYEGDKEVNPFSLT